MRYDHAPARVAQPEIRPVSASPVEAAYCPECGMPAWVEWRDPTLGAGGTVVLAKIRCFARHWFLMPADQVEGLDTA